MKSIKSSQMFLVVSIVLSLAAWAAAPDSGMPRGTRPVDVVKGHAASLLPEGHKFRLVWNDEFDGTELDLSKWGFRTNFWGMRAQWFAGPEDGAVSVSNGVVSLKLIEKNGQFMSPQLQTGELIWDMPVDPTRK